ncbi:MAG: AAA family ATPase [Acidobacteria bacterium]|nr:AAA family ATPase [Acidobacteriota bacterium]
MTAPTAATFAQGLSRAREEYPMYEEYYGFVEKPFSLTPDPKYLYKSESHANAFDLLQYAIRRREGFVVITGDIGTGKTTLCRAILDQLDRKTFTALVLNPFLSEDDLLRLILQDFGVVSRAEIKRGRLTGISKQELIDALNEFLLSLLPLRAGALLIIDEAQNLPRAVLEQIRILSNLETDKEKLLQIVLVGQLNLKDLLRSPDLRQLDQRVSIRYELKPLTREDFGSVHRLRRRVRRGVVPGARRIPAAHSFCPASPCPGASRRAQSDSRRATRAGAGCRPAPSAGHGSCRRSSPGIGSIHCESAFRSFTARAASAAVVAGLVAANGAYRRGPRDARLCSGTAWSRAAASADSRARRDCDRRRRLVWLAVVLVAGGEAGGSYGRANRPPVATRVAVGTADRPDA